MAKEQKMKLYLTSVKEDLNVAAVFQHLAENFIKKVILKEINENMYSILFSDQM